MNRVSGFSLIEVLITFVVISVGLLGYAALQMGALNSSIDSFSRSQATLLLENVATRVSGNKAYLQKDIALLDTPNIYIGNNTSGQYLQWCDNSSGNVPEAACSGGNSCILANRAKQDIHEVCTTLMETRLPEATLGVACYDRDNSDADNCSYGSRMSLYMAWKGKERKDVSGKSSYVQNTRCQTEVGLSSDYACVQMELVP
ncbi:prepilin-type N-terminal cleavage/methylation domain-containing protein [Kangiella sediminilitoris]|uniref:Type IV pilus modification protein PilV n=1 Tax=Kangiella sediminilitoris TaxID=1144748 RepID=A0A1B3BBB5_9GAMM|nr:prepilin-type N-terminal cleavage/methylation domain-containing protein [Kangiella sediminilitoris]AOE50090.1 Type IV pilus modification protein PilV [Kangiella sediminilitoris]